MLLVDEIEPPYQDVSTCGEGTNQVSILEAVVRLGLLGVFAAASDGTTARLAT